MKTSTIWIRFDRWDMMKFLERLILAWKSFLHEQTWICKQRWYLLSKYQYENERTRPRNAASWQKIPVFPKSVLPNPTEYGWLRNEERWHYDSVISILNPAPESVVKWSMQESKTGYSPKQWTFKKNNIVCTDFCLCLECENIEELNFKDDE